MIPKCNHCRSDLPGPHIAGCLLEQVDVLGQNNYIDFLDITRQVLTTFPSRKTKTWLVTERGNAEKILGRIQWYAQWRGYTFAPSPNTIYEEECLRGLAAFCESRTVTHKDMLAALKKKG
jgi:hypothetical protein